MRLAGMAHDDNAPAADAPTVRVSLADELRAMGLMWVPDKGGRL